MAAAVMFSFTESAILRPNGSFCMAKVYPQTKIDASIFIGNRDVTGKAKPRWRRILAAAAILKFTESGIFGHSRPNRCMANIHLSTNVDAHLFVGDRDLVENCRGHLEFSLSAIIGPGNLRMGNSPIMCLRNLVQIDQEVTDIIPVCVVSKWWPSAILDLLFSSFGPRVKSR